MPDVVRQIAFLPRLGYGDYLNFLRLADVLLDTIHFGAGTTTYHALAFGVPLITLTSRFARARGTESAYRRIGMADFVAATPREYVERAVAIANDRALRDSIGREFVDRSGSLFSNPAGAREMEAFFIDAVRRHEAVR